METAGEKKAWWKKKNNKKTTTYQVECNNTFFLLFFFYFLNTFHGNQWFIFSDLYITAEISRWEKAV